MIGLRGGERVKWTDSNGIHCSGTVIRLFTCDKQRTAWASVHDDELKFPVPVRVLTLSLEEV